MAVDSWDELPQDVRYALMAGWRDSLPPLSSAIHARWWQLETWLRQLIYVELRSRYGHQWTQELPKGVEERRSADASRHRYMSTPDGAYHLAYLDVGQLFPLIDQHWDLFEPTLIDKAAWDGRLDELNKIRRRIAHCRRPHADDLNRLELLLRDLEGGAFEALASFNRQWWPDHALADPLVAAWVRGEHSGSDILEHAERQYDTTFTLKYSKRPWAQPKPTGSPISGQPGYLWHTSWFTANSFRLREWWSDTYLDIDNWRDLIVYVCAGPTSIEISFAAVDDPQVIAEGIGHAFQPILQHQNRRGAPTTDDWKAEHGRWLAQAEGLEPRVLVDSGWNIVDDTTTPITIFSA